MTSERPKTPIAMAFAASYRASNLDDWAAFATSNIGMQAVDRASSMRAFRMDDRKQRLFVDRAIEPDAQVFGWEVANAVPGAESIADLDVLVGL